MFIVLEENKELLASAVNINAAQAIIDEYNSLTLNQNKAKTFQDAMRLADVDTMYIRKIHDVLLDGRMADLKNIAIFFNKLKESAIKNIPTPNQ